MSESIPEYLECVGYNTGFRRPVYKFTLDLGVFEQIVLHEWDEDDYGDMGHPRDPGQDHPIGRVLRVGRYAVREVYPEKIRVVLNDGTTTDAWMDESLVVLYKELEHYNLMEGQVYGQKVQVDKEVMMEAIARARVRSVLDDFEWETWS